MVIDILPTQPIQPKNVCRFITKDKKVLQIDLTELPPSQARTILSLIQSSLQKISESGHAVSIEKRFVQNKK